MPSQRLVLTDESDVVVARIKEHYPKCFKVNDDCYLVRFDELIEVEHAGWEY